MGAGDGLGDAARGAAGAGLAPGTRHTYDREFREFELWCEEHGRESLPATSETMAEYAAYLCCDRPVLDRGGLPVPGAFGVAPSSARRMLMSVSAAHKHGGFPAPPMTEADLVVRECEARLADERDLGTASRKAMPPSPAALADMAGRGMAGKQQVIRARDAAMVYLAYETAANASDLVRTDVEDVVEHDWGLAVRRRRSKNGSLGEVLIPAAHTPAGVAAIRQWIATLRDHGITSGPLFPRLDHSGAINPSRYRRGAADGRITAWLAERIVVAAAAEVGLD